MGGLPRRRRAARAGAGRPAWSRISPGCPRRSPGRRAGCGCRCRSGGGRPTGSAVTAGLETARWATADMAFRRTALVRAGGFDERFRAGVPGGRRSGAAAAGVRLVAACRAQRTVDHPVRPASRWVSVRSQAGNADDALMRRLHGSDWRRRAGAPARSAAPARRGHLAAATARWPRRTRRRAAPPAAQRSPGRSSAERAGRCGRALLPRRLAWLAGTVEFAAARIAPGPRTPGEILTMTATSAAIPPAAVAHRLRGELSARRAGPLPAAGVAVLFDRDGTLVRDVPYNSDPALVDPVPGALAALARLRAAGMPVGVVTNQSGIGRGRVSRDQVTGSTTGSRSCSARSTPGSCARTRPRTAAGAASRSRDWCWPPRPRSACPRPAAW